MSKNTLLSTNREARGFRTRVFEAGEVILRQGGAPGCAYILQEGRVEISIGTGPKRRLLGIIKRGGIFGEMSLIDQKPRMADAIATKRTECLVVPPEVFRDKLEKTDPFIRALLRIMTKNIRFLADIDDDEGDEDDDEV